MKIIAVSNSNTIVCTFARITKEKEQNIELTDRLKVSREISSKVAILYIHRIHIRKISSVCFIELVELVYGPFGKSNNLHSTLDF